MPHALRDLPQCCQEPPAPCQNETPAFTSRVPPTQPPARPLGTEDPTQVPVASNNCDYCFLAAGAAKRGAPASVLVILASASVADPDPLDPYNLPGSGSVPNNTAPSV